MDGWIGGWMDTWMNRSMQSCTHQSHTVRTYLAVPYRTAQLYCTYRYSNPLAMTGEQLMDVQVTPEPNNKGKMSIGVGINAMVKVRDLMD